MKIKLNNTIEVEVEENETIFDSLKNNGYILDHSCLSARCRSCITKLKSGRIEKIENDNVLSLQDEKENFILSCNSIPLSDISIDCNYINKENFFTEKITPAKIQKIIKFNDNYLELQLRIPPGSDFKYNPGQYYNIIHDQVERSYSLANVYEKDNILIMYIKNYKNGYMSNFLFNKANINDLIRLKGPYGTFFLKNDNNNIVFLATGTGIAPIKSILDNFNFSENKNIYLFWGMRNEEDFFWQPEFDQEIKFYKVISKPSDKNYKNKGYVQNIALNVIKDFSDYDVYACGSSSMINDSLKLFSKHKLNKERFYSDAFVESK